MHEVRLKKHRSQSYIARTCVTVSAILRCLVSAMVRRCGPPPSAKFRRPALPAKARCPVTKRSLPPPFRRRFAALPDPFCFCYPFGEASPFPLPSDGSLLPLSAIARHPWPEGPWANSRSQLFSTQGSLRIAMAPKSRKRKRNLDSKLLVGVQPKSLNPCHQTRNGSPDRPCGKLSTSELVDPCSRARRKGFVDLG